MQCFQFCYLRLQRDINLIGKGVKIMIVKKIKVTQFDVIRIEVNNNTANLVKLKTEVHRGIWDNAKIGRYMVKNYNDSNITFANVKHLEETYGIEDDKFFDIAQLINSKEI